MITRILFICCFIFSFAGANGQKNVLTLEDAIVGRSSALAPERLSDLQWLPDSETVSFQSKEGDELFIRRPGTRAPTIAVKTETINNALKLELKSFPAVHWQSNQSFIFQSGGTYYNYDYNAEQGKPMLSLPDAASNVDYFYSSNRAAFTKDNNLFVMDASGKEQAVTNFDDANIVSGQAIARQEFGIVKGTFWSSKGNLLAFYQKDETDVADYPMLDINSTPGILSTIKYPMAGQKSEQAKVGVYNTKSGKTIYLQVKGPKDQYLTNLGWGPDEKYVYIAVVNRDQNHMWLQQYDAGTGVFVRTLFEETHPKYVEPENPVWFIPGKPDQFLWLSERDGYMHVYRYNTRGELLGQVTKGDWVVKEILGLGNNPNTLVVVGTDESGLNTNAYSVDLTKGKRSAISKSEGIHSYKLNAEGDALIDTWSNLTIPYIAQVIGTEGNIIETLQTAKSPLVDFKIGSTEIFEVKARDGVQLNARIIKPSDFDPARKYKVLVYVYGGPHAQMVSNRWLAGAPLWMYYLAEKGYIVFTVDNRGSANRGFEFENVIHRQLGKIEMQDQLDGVAYLKTLPYVDSDKMAVHGWSYGGFMTTSLMLRQPGTFKVGVAGGPVTDWKFYEAMYGERYMDRPEENPEGYQKASLLNYVENLKGDLLLIHGTVDPIVVLQHNYALLKAFVDAGVQIDYFAYPMHPHNVRGKDRIHLMDKVIRYIEDKLK
jgi:dipeptidyl-peptidase-4